MADNKRWFKVWNSILTDPSFLDADPELIGRWTLLGAAISLHGENGTLKLSPKALSHIIRCNENDIKMMLHQMPNVTCVCDNGIFTVIIQKWAKYQLDSTGYERLKKHRKTHDDNGARLRLRLRQREDKEIPPISPKGEECFDTFWRHYPRKIGKEAARKAWGKIKAPASTLQVILDALKWQKGSHDWTRDNGQYIPHPATYLNQGRWQDEEARDDRFDFLDEAQTS